MELNRNESITIGTDNVLVSPTKNKPSYRSVISIANTSTGGQKITVSIDSPAVSGAGFVIYPGGSWTDSEEGGYIPTQQQINVVSDLAAGTISLQERVKNGI